MILNSLLRNDFTQSDMSVALHQTILLSNAVKKNKDFVCHTYQLHQTLSAFMLWEQKRGKGGPMSDEMLHSDA